MFKLLSAVSLLASVPASATFLRADVAGSVSFDSQPNALPESLTVSSNFLNYLATPDLPQIGAELGRYGLALQASAVTENPFDPQFGLYQFTGGVLRDGQIVQMILPTLTYVGFDSNGLGSGFLLTLTFDTPISGIADPVDFSAANGDFLDGGIAASDSVSGTFTGSIRQAIIDNVPEPATFALFGLGLIAVGSRRARG